MTLKFLNGWIGKFKRRWKLCTVISYVKVGGADGSAMKLFSLFEMIDSAPMNAVLATACHMKRLVSTNVSLIIQRKRSVSKSFFVAMQTVVSALSWCLLIPLESHAVLWKGVHGSTDLIITTEKVWMTSELFLNWLQSFNARIECTHDRKAILLIDICSAHGNVSAVLEFPNATIDFLPPNTTLRHYQSFQLEQAIALIDETWSPSTRLMFYMPWRWIRIYFKIRIPAQSTTAEGTPK